MFSADTIAKYYLSKDPDRILFNKNVVTKNDRKFYEGNVRLNKYLFLSQVVYLARYGKKLISTQSLSMLLSMSSICGSDDATSAKSFSVSY